MENIIGSKIKLQIDQDDAFDHETGKSTIFKSKAEILESIVNEAREIYNRKQKQDGGS